MHGSSAGCLDANVCPDHSKIISWSYHFQMCHISLSMNPSCQKEKPSMYENETFKEYDIAEVEQDIGKIK